MHCGARRGGGAGQDGGTAERCAQGMNFDLDLQITQDNSLGVVLGSTNKGHPM